MPKPGLGDLVLDLLAGVAHQFVNDFFRQVVSRRAIGARLGRTRLQAARHAPGDQPRYGIAAGMVGAETLREKDPDRHRGSINPTLPKPSCRPEGFLDTILGKQCGEVQIAVTTSLRYRGAETIEPFLASLPLGNWSFTTPLLTREAFFVHITFPANDLHKFKCHSIRTHITPRIPTDTALRAATKSTLAAGVCRFNGRVFQSLSDLQSYVNGWSGSPPGTPSTVFNIMKIYEPTLPSFTTQ